jgi:hypothetical protein
MWSGRVYRPNAPRRTIAAKNKRDADQKSAAHPTELDSDLRLLEFRNRHSQQACIGREWFQLTVFQMRWD